MSFNRIPNFNDRVCTKCQYYYQEWDGEIGEIYCGDFCEKESQEHLSNLKSFPFKKVMPCFEMSFWHSEFAELYGCIKSDPKEESGEPVLERSLAFTEFQKHYNNPGTPPGSFRTKVDEMKKRDDFEEIY